MHFKILSAICFNLDQPKILSSGNGLSQLLHVPLASMTRINQDLTAAPEFKSDLVSTLPHPPLLRYPSSINTFGLVHDALEFRL